MYYTSSEPNFWKSERECNQPPPPLTHYRQTFILYYCVLFLSISESSLPVYSVYPGAS